MLVKLEALKETTGRNTAAETFLRNHPRTELFEDLKTAWNAFADLDVLRPLGLYRIPPSEIEAWCRLHGITDPAITEQIYFGVRTLDEAMFRTRRAAAKEPPDNG